MASVIGRKIKGVGKVIGFGAAPGAPFGDEQAAEIGAALEAIAEPDGQILTESILEAATSSDSPLHALLEWEDSKAAHAHRMNQAREIISHLQLVVQQPGGAVTRQKFALSLQVVVPENEKSGGTIGERQTVRLQTRAYIPTPQVVAIPAQSRQAEAQALHELRCWYRRYAPLKLPGLTEATKAVEDLLGK